MTTNIATKSKEHLKQSILEYIKSEATKGHYPTFMEIEEKFHTNMRTHFSRIQEAYWLAHIPYKREPNQFLKYEKERKLADISVKIFRKMGYTIEKVSIGPRGSGPDVVLKDENGILIPVEIKAYQKFGKIKDVDGDAFSHYFTNEIMQLRQYEMQLKSPYGYLVTSTDRKSFQYVDRRIKVLFSKHIRKLLIKYGMKRELETLDWIRDTPVLAEKERKIKAMQKSILDYVKKKLNEGNYVSKREIQAKFKVDLRSYFRTMKDAYLAAGVDPYSLSHARMGGQIDKEILKKRIVSYVRKETKKGNYPTYKEIQRRFQCLPKAFFPGGIREVYELAEVPYARKFATKTPKEKEEMKKKILNYIKTEAQNGYFPTWRDVQNKFKVNILHYFKGMQEIYLMSKVTLLPRKGLKALPN